jgi:enhancer of mRNA-decapping protein 4
VYIWNFDRADSLSGDVARGTIEPFEGQEVGSVSWVSVGGSSAWLLTGDAVNRELCLFQGSASSGFFARQTLRLESLEGIQAFFNHLVWHEATRTVVLANARRKAVYTVHLSTCQDGSLRFDYLARFSVSYPILSLTASDVLAGEEDGDASGAIQLFCVQTDAIQRYSLHPSTCQPPVGPAFAASLEHRISTASTIPAVSVAPSSILAVSGPAADLPRPLDATKSDIASRNEQEDLSVSAPAQQQHREEAALGGAAASVPVSLPLPPPVMTPPAAAVPQPRLLTPKQLIKLAGSRTDSLGSSATMDHGQDMHSPLQPLPSQGTPALLSPRPSASPPSPSPAIPSAVFPVDAAVNEPPAHAVPTTKSTVTSQLEPSMQERAGVNGTAGTPKREKDDDENPQSRPGETEV